MVDDGDGDDDDDDDDGDCNGGADCGDAGDDVGVRYT